jgi:hypothetical protein
MNFNRNLKCKKFRVQIMRSDRLQIIFKYQFKAIKVVETLMAILIYWWVQMESFISHAIFQTKSLIIIICISPLSAAALYVHFRAQIKATQKLWKCCFNSYSVELMNFFASFCPFSLLRRFPSSVHKPS